MTDFWRVFFHGLSHVVRLVNTHVVLAILTLYAAFDMILKQIMLLVMGQNRGILNLFDRTFFATTMFGIASFLTMFIVTIVFQLIYRSMRGRLEKPKEQYHWMFESAFFHWIMTAGSFVICGPFFFLGLAVAVWIAAASILVNKSFHYEVASKPTKALRSTS